MTIRRVLLIYIWSFSVLWTVRGRRLGLYLFLTLLTPLLQGLSVLILNELSSVTDLGQSNSDSATRTYLFVALFLASAVGSLVSLFLLRRKSVLFARNCDGYIISHLLKALDASDLSASDRSKYASLVNWDTYMFTMVLRGIFMNPQSLITVLFSFYLLRTVGFAGVLAVGALLLVFAMSQFVALRRVSKLAHKVEEARGMWAAARTVRLREQSPLTGEDSLAVARSIGDFEAKFDARLVAGYGASISAQGSVVITLALVAGINSLLRLDINVPSLIMLLFALGGAMATIAASFTEIGKYGPRLSRLYEAFQTDDLSRWTSPSGSQGEEEEA